MAKTKPSPGGSERQHARYLRWLWESARDNADTCRALIALTDTDRRWLEERGWVEPDYSWYIRLNGARWLNEEPKFR